MKKSRLLCTVCICSTSLFSISAHAIGVSGPGTLEITLQGRDLYGDATTFFEGYSHTILDITWLDAQFTVSQLHTYLATSGSSTDHTFYEITVWHQPAANDVNCYELTHSNIYQGVDAGYNRKSRLGTQSASFYYRNLKDLADMRRPFDTGDFRLMSRCAPDALNITPEHLRNCCASSTSLLRFGLYTSNNNYHTRGHSIC